MKKINSSKIYILIIAVLICVAIAFSVRYLLNTRKIQASISSTEVNWGEYINYSDSTFNSESWLWEFGDGEKTNQTKGAHRYKNPGTYQIRLTVDDALQKEFIVNVKEDTNIKIDSLIKITAPTVAVQDEFIVFQGIGYSKEWRWSFGESGIVDSRDQVAVYAYSYPGVYDIELMTEETKYPIRHRIEVFPKFMENDTTDILVIIGNDIKDKLQAIVDGKPFNVSYNHILKNYLCNNPHVKVSVNNDKHNDFYSYCQGLKILGKRKTVISNVIVTQDENNLDCLNLLSVTQYLKE